MVYSHGSVHTDKDRQIGIDIHFSKNNSVNQVHAWFKNVIKWNYKNVLLCLFFTDPVTNNHGTTAS